jgi:diguanylate cyclase (GGDEF)-like protein/PAS domain S-box-containing protein
MRRFLALITLAWVIPPIFGLSFLLFINMFTVEQMTVVLTTWAEPVFIVVSFVFSLWYFRRFVQPIVNYLAFPIEENETQALNCIRNFPLHFWGMFLIYLCIAPSTVIFSAEAFTDYMAPPIDWFRISLVAIIVSIIVGLPIFFQIYDLFGNTLQDVRLKRPVVTLRTKVFMIGALMPLLVDTMLVQYYWKETGYFTFTTFVIWALLEVLAVVASLMFVNSLGQALVPLQAVVADEGPLLTKKPDMRGQSTDELGVLTGRYQSLLEQLYFHRQALEVGNRLSRKGWSAKAIGEAHERLTSICREALSLDIAFLLLYDSEADELVGICQTGSPYKAEGHFRIAINEPSMSMRIFKEGRLMAVDDITENPGIGNPRIIEQFNVKSAIGTPMMAEDEVIGVLMGATTGRIHHFTTRDYDMISLLAHEAALVVHTQSLQHKRQQAESRFLEASELAKVTLHSIGDGVITTDCDGIVEYMNPVAEKLTGWTNEEAIGQGLETVFNLVDEESRTPVEGSVIRCLKGKATFSLPSHTLLLHREGHKEYSVEVRVSPMMLEKDKARGAVLVFHDITELAMMSHRLSYQASHDSLTGLINRRELEVRLELALEDARQEMTQHALCYMDLDQFKVVNDTCGHVAGDELLKQLAVRMRAAIRESDTMARLGGDEFGLLLEGCTLERAERVAEHLMQIVRDFRFVWGDKAFDVGMSIGLVPISAESGSLTDVLGAADSACYTAKDLGRNRIHVFEENDLILAKHRGDMQWLQRIRQALDQDEFLLYRQTIQPLAGDDGAWRREILLRLRGEDGKVILPGGFLPVAERYHLMPAIDRWVIRKALAMLQDFDEVGNEGYVSINLSGQTLCDDGFLQFVTSAIQASGVPPQYLCFEITETTAIANLSRAVDLIKTLKGMGCRFALDDFGSGLSSFGYLKNLPVDYLKIDGAFVKDMESNPIDKAMVHSINEIGHLMGIETVAEFVGNETVMHMLSEMGVDYAQGYHIGKPQPLMGDAAFQRGDSMIFKAP